MAKVLVVDDERGIRDLLTKRLANAGYEVIEAEGGRSALIMARQQRPDVILLDLIMPVMDGFEVLGRLRGNPETEAIPVIFLTALPAEHGETQGMRFGVTHYITKPWKRGMVEAAVNVALRESTTPTGEASVSQTPAIPQVLSVVKTGERLLDDRLGGGIRPGSLTLIEGTSSAGKSVLCQHLVYGALTGGHGVAFCTSENTVNSLVTQMRSIGLDVEDHLKRGRLKICPVEELTTGGEAEGLMANLAHNMEQLTRQFSVITVDAITNIASYSQEIPIITFFSHCKRLCSLGTTVILVAHSAAFDEKLLVRLRALCDAHLSLRVERLGANLSKTLEARKIHNADMNTGNMVNFDVEPGIGIRISPVNRVKA